MNVVLNGLSRHYRTVSFDAATNAVVLIEQRMLPHQFQLVQTADYRETAAAIRDMIVRGAGAIGATAAYGLAQGVRAFRGSGLAAFEKHVARVFQALADARPTAVDPLNAMRGVLAEMQAGETVAERQALALAAAEEFAHENVNNCRAIGQQGARLIRHGMTVLTHCNAGWLAFVDIGTATAPLYAAQARGKRFRVICDETRPRCQGSSLTAWELAQQGIEHRVIADNAAGHLMQRGEIDLVIVGSDRVLGRTGEVANKIGTYTKAVLAHRHKIPFYVAIPLSTIDWTLESGEAIPIEERDADEVLCADGLLLHPQSSTRNPQSGRRVQIRVANPTSRALNPGFDVTPPELITAIITPLGLFKPKDLWPHLHSLTSQSAARNPGRT
ncbi:MAG: S-methyl-5-thioribose-1-phosphate isomerase [Verrucomicrobia bacterium]|jgi:S-methyl-5-thioribose-1-phosphate isomerase|nr:S-methyl-5-thioribose-1-phosphate isomerase [Verrucomicrobiota bacterium]